MTGSAKTGHNRTSLNLQYKALNTLGGIGKTGRGAGAGTGDYLVKPGIGNREIT